MLTAKQTIKYMKDNNYPAMYGDGHYVYDIKLVDGKCQVQQNYVDTHQNLVCKKVKMLTEEQFLEWGADKMFDTLALY